MAYRGRVALRTSDVVGCTPYTRGPLCSRWPGRRSVHGPAVLGAVDTPESLRVLTGSCHLSHANRYMSRGPQAGRARHSAAYALPDRPPVSDSRDRLLDSFPGISRQNVQLPENVWELKPAWCQPWSILMAGAAVPLAAYNISSGSVLLAVLVSIPVLIWWYTFLVLYPAGYREYRTSVMATQSMDEDDVLPGA